MFQHTLLVLLFLSFFSPFFHSLLLVDLIAEIDMHCRIFLIVVVGSHLAPVIKFYVSILLCMKEWPFGERERKGKQGRKRVICYLAYIQTHRTSERATCLLNNFVGRKKVLPKAKDHFIVIVVWLACSLADAAAASLCDNMRKCRIFQMKTDKAMECLFSALRQTCSLVVVIV